MLGKAEQDMLPVRRYAKGINRLGARGGGFLQVLPDEIRHRLQISDDLGGFARVEARDGVDLCGLEGDPGGSHDQRRIDKGGRDFGDRLQFERQIRTAGVVDDPGSGLYLAGTTTVRLNVGQAEALFGRWNVIGS